ncbi:MAG: hypothetical protein KC503_29995 [Myxococcales bacterium]|nr:hypothetical protein [Myxococcales bacterium]
MNRPLLAAAVALSLLAPSPAEAQRKFALSMFHFNVQYVVGGLRGFPNGKVVEAFDFNNDQVEDLIITESFEPVLDLYAKHPSWQVTLEMQAYMVEVLRRRHPRVLSKLKAMYDAGQVEIVSFHWSDQLFLAYPKVAMERSRELMLREWKASGIGPSRVVFCQEGQFGLGMIPLAKLWGREVLVLAKNLFRYQHQSAYETAPPLYQRDGVDILLMGRGFKTDKVEVTWTFADDGELLATGDLPPYAGALFVKNPQALADYEAKLVALEQQGFTISNIANFVDWSKKQGVKQEPLPDVLDGTWQPGSTDSMFRWMGASGLSDVINRAEQDNTITSGNVRTLQIVQAAEKVAAHAVKAGWASKGAHDAELRQCWRDALLAQVSDTTGVNPIANEVAYGLDHAAAARACAEGIIKTYAGRWSFDVQWLRVDLADGSVLGSNVAAPPAPTATPAKPASSPFADDARFTLDAGDRDPQLTWEAFGDDRVRLTIEIQPSKKGWRTVEVSFPLDLDAFYVTPGLRDDQVGKYPFSSFELEKPRITLPLSNGLVGIGKDTWLIKQTNSVHIGAIFEPSQEKRTVRFRDETVPPLETVKWTFWIVRGDEQAALAAARRINITPVVSVRVRDAAQVLTEDDDGGCAVGAAKGAAPGPSALWLLLALGALLVARRRR